MRLEVWETHISFRTRTLDFVHRHIHWDCVSKDRRNKNCETIFLNMILFMWFLQILEALMDIMQVLQDICKNPEAYDKGANITHLVLPF